MPKKSHEATRIGDKTLCETFGDNIRNLRINAGLQQADLSLKLGVDRTAVSSWERGKSSPCIENLFQLCNVLDITPNTLFNWEG